MPPSRPPPAGWQSYDSVAEAYERAAVPRFLPLARDLVAAVASPPDGVVLDMGTGTGLAAQIARESLGPRGFVVGLDPSIAMLGQAATRRLTLVAGMFPGLPFRDAAFDAAIANLVLSHLADHEEGLADAARVLRPGGRLGCTAWGPDVPTSDQNQAGQADEVIESLAVARGLDVTPPTPAVPSEDRWRDRDKLEAAFRGAGLVDTNVESRTYHWVSSIDEYLAGREWRPRSRYIRQQADSRLWREIQDRGASEIRLRIGEKLHSMGDFWVAVGTKPS